MFVLKIKGCFETIVGEIVAKSPYKLHLFTRPRSVLWHAASLSTKGFPTKTFPTVSPDVCGLRAGMIRVWPGVGPKTITVAGRGTGCAWTCCAAIRMSCHA